jgi:1-acyl-sn-glycerol-3-phosphate acyltransferase
MITKSKHHPFYYTCFRLFYAKWKINRHFHTVNILGNFQEKNLPILIIANHVSWWDGIWVMLLNIRLLKRRFHFMMLNEQMKKLKVFNYVGGYSVQKKSKSIMESLRYTIELLSNNKNMVLLFPQGEIQSLYTSSIQFERGIDYILKRTNGYIQVLFLVNMIDYFSNTKPTLYMYMQEYHSVGFIPGKAQMDYDLFYAQCMREQSNKIDD